MLSESLADRGVFSLIFTALHRMPGENGACRVFEGSRRGEGLVSVLLPELVSEPPQFAGV